MSDVQLALEGTAPAPVKFTVVDHSGLVQHYEGTELTLTEVRPPSSVQPGMSAAAAGEEVTVHHFDDDTLARYALQLRRAIEDAQRAGRSAQADEKALRITVALQHVRLRLRWRYGARDAYGPPGERGTDVYDRWLRHDEAPSYALAFALDRLRHRQGKSHVVAWNG